MKNIFHYLDYRRYLKDFYQNKKDVDRSYSYRVFLNKANISSPSFMKQVIDSKRNLTPSTVEKFLTPLKLNKKEANFFRCLVLFNQSKSSDEKAVHYKSLREFSKASKVPILGEDSFDYYEHWYTSALRELVVQMPKTEDYTALGKLLSPTVSSAKVKKSIELLLKLKLIQVENNRYVQSSPLITTGNEVNSMVVRRFNKAMIENSIDAIDMHSPEVRDIRGVTMGVSEDTYQLIAEEMSRFQDRVMDLLSLDKSPTSVYQLNLQLFPLTQPKKGSTKDA